VLDGEHVAHLDAATAPALGSPYEFLAWAAASSYTFGEAYAKLDQHRAGRSGRAFEVHFGN